MYSLNLGIAISNSWYSHIPYRIAPKRDSSPANLQAKNRDEPLPSNRKSWPETRLREA